MVVSGYPKRIFKATTLWKVLACFLLLCSMSTLGCATLSPAVVSPDAISENTVPPNPDIEIPIISTPQSPLSLQITQVKNDGKTLRVEGIVSTKAPWYVDKVSIGLTGFSEGIEVASVAKPLKDFLSPTQMAHTNSSSPLAAGSAVLHEEAPLAFSLSLPSVNISDYQVTLGWGNEAVLTKSKLVVWEEQSIVDLGSDPNCVNIDCPHLYAVEGALRNDGQELVSGVVVSLKLQIDNSENADTSDSSSDTGEREEIDLSPLNLPPGASQRVRLRFKNSIDVEPLGGIRAEVLVKSVK